MQHKDACDRRSRDRRLPGGFVGPFPDPFLGRFVGPVGGGLPGGKRGGASSVRGEEPAPRRPARCRGGGYRVVATLAGQGGTPIRFESTLLPEQKVVVSIPGWAGAKDWTIEFLRRDDRLVVETN